MPLHRPHEQSENRRDTTDADCAPGAIRAMDQLMPAAVRTRQYGCRRRISGRPGDGRFDDALRDVDCDAYSGRRVKD